MPSASRPTRPRCWPSCARRYVGLSLADLNALAGDGRQLTDLDALERLDGDACVRATSVFRLRWRMRKPCGNAGRYSPIWSKAPGIVWVAHRAVEKPATELKEAQAFFRCLVRGRRRRPAGRLERFCRAAWIGRFTEGDPPSDEVKLEILTMHGAKGLEWDSGRAARSQPQHARPRIVNCSTGCRSLPDEGDEQVLAWHRCARPDRSRIRPE